SYKTLPKSKPMQLFNYYMEMIDKTRDLEESHFITNYNEIVAYYKDTLPITNRVLEDSRIVNAFQVYIDDSRKALEEYEEYKVPSNIFLPILGEVSVFKFLYGT